MALSNTHKKNDTNTTIDDLSKGSLHSSYENYKSIVFLRLCKENSAKRTDKRISTGLQLRSIFYTKCVNKLNTVFFLEHIRKTILIL